MKKLILAMILFGCNSQPKIPEVEAGTVTRWYLEERKPDTLLLKFSSGSIDTNHIYNIRLGLHSDTVIQGYTEIYAVKDSGKPWKIINAEKAIQTLLNSMKMELRRDSIHSSNYFCLEKERIRIDSGVGVIKWQ